MKHKLNLRMFDVINTTLSDGMTAEMKEFYSNYLIKSVLPKLVHDQFGQTHNIPKNGGKVIEFRRYKPLGKALTPLTEGVTPESQELKVTTVTAEVKQYGGFVRLSDMLILTALDNNIVEALDQITGQARTTLDTVTREVLNAGTNVQYAEGQVTSRSELTQEHKLTVRAIRMAVRLLKKMNTNEIDGSYVGIINQDVAYDLMDDEDWKEWNKYTTPEHMFNNEIGQIAGVRFCWTSEAKIFASEGAGGIDVYSTLILGANAYGTTNVENGGLKTIIKQLGSGGTADPLDQRATVGWKATKTAVILSDEYMVRIETGSSFSDGVAN